MFKIYLYPESYWLSDGLEVEVEVGGLKKHSLVLVARVVMSRLGTFLGEDVGGVCKLLYERCFSVDRLRKDCRPFGAWVR